MEKRERMCDKAETEVEHSGRHGEPRVQVQPRKKLTTTGTWEEGARLKKMNWNDLDQQRSTREVGETGGSEQLSVPIHTDSVNKGKVIC